MTVHDTTLIQGRPKGLAQKQSMWYVIDVWQKLKVRSRVRSRDVAGGVLVCSMFGAAEWNW